MKLYGGRLSPYVHRVLLGARIKGHDLPLTPIPAEGLKSATFLAKNPLGRMPVLELDDGWRLAESGPILRHLDEHLDGPPLEWGSLAHRSHARWITQIAEVELGAHLTQLLRRRLSARGRPSHVAGAALTEICDEHLAGIHSALDAIATLRAGSDRWATGDRPGMADAMLLPLMVMIEVFSPYNDYRDRILIPASLKAYLTGAMEDDRVAGLFAAMDGSLATMAPQWGLRPCGAT